MKFHVDGTLPENGEIFVFGSNLAGHHGKGAALVAAEKFGANVSTAIGRCGQSYAIPTKSFRLQTLPLPQVISSIKNFLVYAWAATGEEFFVTRIGCGLAGYKDEQIAPHFKNAPDNCSFAEEWREWIIGGKYA